MDSGIELPVGRSRHLYDLIAAERQGLGGRHAPGVSGDIVHHLAAALLNDLINGALERGASCGTRNVVGFSSVLVDLDLAGDGGVLPLNLNSLARLDIDSLVLLV